MPKAGLMFAKKDDWATPKSIVAHFGKFDYDPATTKAKADEFGVANFDTIETDGLKSDWTRFRRIWINPPFTRKQEFLKKAVETFWQTKADIYILLPIDFLTTKSFYDILRPWGGGCLCAKWANQVRKWRWGHKLTGLWELCHEAGRHIYHHHGKV